MIKRMLLVLIAVTCGSAAVSAKNATSAKPLWEVGVAGGAGYLADYPAAGQNHVHGIALPFVVYRGDIIRAGDNGLVRGRILHTDRMEFDISVDASFPADSNSNKARKGMPDLNFLFEVGPRFQFTLARAARWAKIDFELPLRAVFSADFFSVGLEGFLLQPTLAYQHEHFLQTDTELKVALSSIIATEGLHDLFYQVNRRFATPTRAAFNADAGYLGSELEVKALTRVNSRISVFGVARADYFGGAANENSPLFRDKFNFSVGAGMIVRLFRSRSMVRE